MGKIACWIVGAGGIGNGSATAQTQLYIKFLVSVRASVSTRAEKVWHGMSVKVSVRDQTGYGYG